MGQFKIEVTAVGGHGQDRNKKDGEVVDFKEGDYIKEGNENPSYKSPDSHAKDFVDKLIASGVNVESASITHWPDTPSEVKDDLMTGVRKGNF